MSNYYDVLVSKDNGVSGKNEQILTKVNYETANLVVLSLRAEGKIANIWYGVDIYKTTDITHDNLNRFYPYMSNEDKIKYKEIINTILLSRIKTVEEHLSMDLANIEYARINFDSNYMIEQSIFGIVDTLEPIDNYVSKIKKSKKYLELIK